MSSALAAALDGGLTVNECREVLIHLYAYAGFPRSIQGLRTLLAVREERRAAGITDPAGAEASPIATTDMKYDRGKAILDSLVGRTLEGRSDYGDFAPAIDRFLKEHLFADLFERDVLGFLEREIATISILASMDGVEPMLAGHLGIARNLGVAESDLRMILDVIAVTAGRDYAQRARDLLNQP